jgi:hypothetical protein
MQKLLVSAFVGLLFVGVGCKSDNMRDDDMNSRRDSKKMSMKDDCAMCPGQQTAKADGTCPKCGMKVKG